MLLLLLMVTMLLFCEDDEAWCDCWRLLLLTSPLVLICLDELLDA